MFRYLISAVLALSGSMDQLPAPSSASWPNWINLSESADLSESYRLEFGRCDREDRFLDYRFPATINGRRYYPCRSDRSAVTALRRMAPQPGRDEAIILTSKLSVDLDGSWFACNTPGRTDQCPTAMSLRDRAGREVPVSSDEIPYVVIPVAGPTPQLGREFRDLTGVRMGDFGVVVTQNQVIPVIVADGGPFNKMGEGSIALHRALGRELCATQDSSGRCTTMVRPLVSHAGPLVTILFPGSRRSDVRPDNIAAITRSEGLRHWETVRRALGR